MMFRNIPLKTNFVQMHLKKWIHYSKQGTFYAHPQKIFKVVRNTDKYSQFIPWCSRSTLTNKISATQNFTQLTITFKKVKQLSYLSHVRIYGQNNPDQKYKVQSICNDQPLKSLISTWQIQKNSTTQGQLIQTHVKYQIQYQFATPLLQLTSHFFLNYVGQSMWLIFKEQAERKQKQADSIIHKQYQKSYNNLSSGKSQIFIASNEKEEESIRQVDCLSDYLGKNLKIRDIYLKNLDFKNKLDQWSKNLYGTKNFEEKLEFKINNYLIYRV